MPASISIARDRADLTSVRANLFPAAHAAVGASEADWLSFRWHRRHGRIQAMKPQSSQALAIDIFGTIKASGAADRFLDALTARLGLPVGGPWMLHLEWTDPDNNLAEVQPTQVDVAAFGARSLILIECKFTEPGGSCSQTRRILSGAHKGLRQCSGSYAPQVNPVNGRVARCALSAKGIRYWSLIPELFGLDVETDHVPCPFAGEAYQWMRNLVLALDLGRSRGLVPTVLVAYADAPSLPTALKMRSAEWAALGASLRPGAPRLAAIGYGEIVALAGEFDGLAEWVARKGALVEPGTIRPVESPP